MSDSSNTNDSTGATDAASSVESAAPGVQAHVPGEDDTDATVGGVVPGGASIEHAADDELPAEQGLSNAGDTVADDDELPSDDLAPEQ